MHPRSYTRNNPLATDVRRKKKRATGELDWADWKGTSKIVIHAISFLLPLGTFSSSSFTSTRKREIIQVTEYSWYIVRWILTIKEVARIRWWYQSNLYKDLLLRYGRLFQLEMFHVLPFSCSLCPHFFASLVTSTHMYKRNNVILWKWLFTSQAEGKWKRPEKRNVKVNSISINIVIEKIRWKVINEFVFCFVKLNEWNIEGGEGSANF